MDEPIPIGQHFDIQPIPTGQYLISNWFLQVNIWSSTDCYRSIFDIQLIPTGQHLISNWFLQVNIWYSTDSYRSTYFDIHPIPTGQHLIFHQLLQVNIWYSTDSYRSTFDIQPIHDWYNNWWWFLRGNWDVRFLQIQFSVRLIHRGVRILNGKFHCEIIRWMSVFESK